MHKLGGGGVQNYMGGGSSRIFEMFIFWPKRVNFLKIKLQNFNKRGDGRLFDRVCRVE